MKIFGTKHASLPQAVLAGDLRAVRAMLAKGADPNACDPGDEDGYPIHYALNHGPEMVQALIDSGADVNVPGRGNATPLAKAESRGFTEIAAILRKAGASVRTSRDAYSMDPRFRLQIEPRIKDLVFHTRLRYHDRRIEDSWVVDEIEAALNYRFPAEMPLQQQEKVRREIRALIVSTWKNG